MNRVFGIETEFGCLVKSPSLGPPERVVELVKESVFKDNKWGLLDWHVRDPFFEPARSGGFLINGGRLYIDAVGSHEEYATPECRSIFDIVAYDKAGQRIICQALNELGFQDKVSFHNNNIDHFGGHTFGCHENYSLSPDKYFSRKALQPLVAFLVTRQIFAGAGRVGGHKLIPTRHSRRSSTLLGDVDYVFVDSAYEVKPDPDVKFQLSQRADHILHVVSGRVRFNRGLINPKWDSYHDFSRYTRLHLLFGESNVSEYATALKIGTTALVLDLLEMRCIPEIELAHPIKSLKEISRDMTWRWITTLRDGKTISAIDIQRCYLQAAQRHLAGRDEETDWVLREWEYVLDKLEADPLELSDRLDWVAKFKMLQLFMDAEGVGWDDEALISIDLEYHNINPEESLFYVLQRSGKTVRVVTDEQIEHAMVNPPRNTRAYARGLIVKEFIKRGITNYIIEWDCISLACNLFSDRKWFIMDDPFETYERHVDWFIKKLR
ncbi:MAG: hypothetical protein RUDDFDWM_001092 [Candidatus Fervidibacterota bacterium]